MSEESSDAGDSLEYRSSGDRFRVEFAETDDEPSTTIVRAVAAIAGCKPDDLDPLYAVIEPDALDSIFQPTGRGDHQGGGEVFFTYQGFRVSVKSDGIVEIEPHDDAVTPEDADSE